MLKLANLLKLGNLMNLETSEPTTPTSLLVKLVRLVAPVHLVNSKSVALPFILRFGPKSWGGGVLLRLTGSGLHIHVGKDQKAERQKCQLHPERAVR